jgi:hypothetical protein
MPDPPSPGPRAMPLRSHRMLSGAAHFFLGKPPPSRPPYTACFRSPSRNRVRGDCCLLPTVRPLLAFAKMALAIPEGRGASKCVGGGGEGGAGA